MIRQAYRHDIAHIVEMMRHYAKEAPVNALKNSDHQDKGHVSNIILTLMAGKGFVLVDDQLRGFIAAIVAPNIWCPDVLELHELAWWVKPEDRGTSLGGKLWLAFNKKAQEFLDSNRVQVVRVTSLSTSPTLDYTKRGFTALETAYFREQ